MDIDQGSQTAARGPHAAISPEEKLRISKQSHFFSGPARLLSKPLAAPESVKV